MCGAQAGTLCMLGSLVGLVLIRACEVSLELCADMLACGCLLVLAAVLCCLPAAGIRAWDNHVVCACVPRVPWVHVRLGPNPASAVAPGAAVT